MQFEIESMPIVWNKLYQFQTNVIKI